MIRNLMTAPAHRSHHRNRGGVFGVLLSLIVLMVVAIIVLLTTDPGRRVIHRIAAAVSDETASPAPTDTPASTAPKPAPAPTQPVPPPPAPTAPSVNQATPAGDATVQKPTEPPVDPEVLRKQKVDRESRAHFALAESYYKARKFDLAVEQLQQVIALDDPDWVAKAKTRLEFVQSVRNAN